MTNYTPTPADRFTFGLWPVGNVRRDPFGKATRSDFPALQTLCRPTVEVWPGTRGAANTSRPTQSGATA